MELSSVLFDVLERWDAAIGEGGWEAKEGAQERGYMYAHAQFTVIAEETNTV